MPPPRFDRVNFHQPESIVKTCDGFVELHEDCVDVAEGVVTNLNTKMLK